MLCAIKSSSKNLLGCVFQQNAEFSEEPHLTERAAVKIASVLSKKNQNDFFLDTQKQIRYPNESKRSLIFSTIISLKTSAYRGKHHEN